MRESRHDVELTLTGDTTGGPVTVADVLFATPEDAWLTSASLPSEPLARCRDVDPLQPLPVLYGEPTVDGIDVFGSVFFLLTRYEELVGDVRDTHERFPASTSLAVREGFLARPLANEYAELLWSRLTAAWPRLTRRRRSYALRLSHDVDFPLYRAPPREARAIAKRDLRREHAPLLALRRVVNALAPDLTPKSLDLNNTFDWLMHAGEDLGLRSTPSTSSPAGTPARSTARTEIDVPVDPRPALPHPHARPRDRIPRELQHVPRSGTHPLGGRAAPPCV